MDALELEFEQAIEQWHRAQDEMHQGNPEPVLKMWSERDDITLAEPLGTLQVGRKQVADNVRLNASFYLEGDPVQQENIAKVVTPGFGFIVEVERSKVKVRGDEMSTLVLRATTIFRREEGGWKVMHRHADPLTAKKPIEWATQK